MTQKFKTVNVLKQIGVAVADLTSFADTTEGNKAAEELFVKLIKDGEEYDSELLEDYLEDGTYRSGNTLITICHSTSEGEKIPISDPVKIIANAIMDSTEYLDDLPNNMGTYLEDLTDRIEDEVQELAAETFEICPECGHQLKSVMIETDGTNLEEGTECSNPDCVSHEEVDNTD